MEHLQDWTCKQCSVIKTPWRGLRQLQSLQRCPGLAQKVEGSKRGLKPPRTQGRPGRGGAASRVRWALQPRRRWALPSPGLPGGGHAPPKEAASSRRAGSPGPGAHAGTYSY